MAGYYEWSVSDVDGKKDPRFTNTPSPAITVSGSFGQLAERVVQ